MSSEARAPTQPRIRVTGKGDTAADFTCDAGEPILRAGLRAGWDLPYECASGTCGTCKATLVDGEIVCAWPEAPGHTFVKNERNEFLMCQSLALADTTIAVSRRIEPALASRVRPRSIVGTLGKIERRARDVVSFEVALDESIDYAAGQFVLFDIDAIPGSRSYSMVAHAPGATSLEFLVKRFPGGALGAWLFDGAAEGTTVRLFGPLGRATFEPELGHHLCCIAGGSGIAGMMAILSHAVRLGYFAEKTGDVFFGVRTPEDTFYLDELSAFVGASSGNVRVTVALSDADVTPDLLARYPRLAFGRGFVHDVARETCVGLRDTMFFVAGPLPMVDGALRMLLLDAKVPGAQIRYDKFS